VRWIGEALPDGLRAGDYWNGQRVESVDREGPTVIVNFDDDLGRKSSGETPS
jgi:hypothetical protein